MKKLPISTSILSILYALYLVAGLYSFLNGEFSIVRLVFFLLAFVTLFSLIDIGGKMVWRTGLFYGVFLIVLGIGLLCIWAFEFYVDGFNDTLSGASGTMFIMLGSSTVWILRKKTLKIS